MNRAACTLLILAGALSMSGCGSTSTPPPVSLTPAVPQVLNQGETLNVTAALADDPSRKGVTWSLNPSTGALANETSNSVIYQAPDMVTSNFIVTVTATSVADSSESAPLVIIVLAPGQANVHPVAVNRGPLVGQTYLNGPFTTVMICEPGTSNCQSIDGILVDTGSTGLRIFKSLLSISLPPINQSGGSLNNCVSFVGMQFLWGEIAPADVYLAGEKATSVSVQLVADPTSFTIPTSCSNGGVDGVEQRAFNGIIGVGSEPTDCTISGTNSCDPGSGADPHPPYYVCFGGQGCAPTLVLKSQQVSNPVAAFATDNNGDILEFPAVGSAMAGVSGSLTFGINTRLNNNIGSAMVFGINGQFFTTVFANQQLTNSFIDSGSNELVFPNFAGIPLCSDGDSYCPASAVVLSANNEGARGVGTGVVNFQVDNFETDTTNHTSDAAFGYIAAGGHQNTPCQNSQGSCMFDWGLPFFYGRKVFTSIDTRAVVNAPNTPWWAY